MAAKIAVAADHGGKELKRLICDFLQLSDYSPVDYGVDHNSNASVDYPDYAALVAEDVAAGRVDKGILICGTGIGMSITANKFPGVRAALVWDEFTAEMSRLHNNANIICLGARTVNHMRAVDFLKIWLRIGFEQDRHVKRLQKIIDIEKKNFKPRV